MQSSSIDLKRRAEAARYALLQRLAPALRHDMAGNFQPVTMMAMILEKRMQAAAPDLSTLVKNCGEIRTLSIAATHSNLDLMGWIAVDPKASVSLAEGVKKVLHLMTTELSVRGIRFINHTEDVTTVVALPRMYGVFTAALLALTDTAAAPANVHITSVRDEHDMLITLTLKDAADASSASLPYEALQIGLAAYRNIDWDDVQAIADEDGLSVQHKATSVQLRLPISTV
jgi:SHS2 domain-containing protein